MKKLLIIPILLLLLIVSCKDAIVVFDNETCTDSVVPTNLPQQQNFYTKDWILYQNGVKTDLVLANDSVNIRVRFHQNGTGEITINDTNSIRRDSSMYGFTYKFCKTDCNCNLIRFYGSIPPQSKYKSIAHQILKMKMYSAVSIPINNGASAINGLLLIDEKEYTMTFR